LGFKEKNERTGIETKSVFTAILEAEDSRGFNGFPISNTRKIHWKGAVIETLWLLGIHMKDDRY
jgi:thymidylate synthase